ncbi:MAG: class I SAM-dependent methyltransferase [Chthoniobacterales bacterium]
MSENWMSHSVRQQLEVEGTTAHRVYTSSSAWIDRYGFYYVISSMRENDAAILLAALEKWIEKDRDFPLPQAVFFRHLVVAAKRENTPHLLIGNAPQERISILENGLQYLIDFRAGYSVGLFCDQRKNRAFLAERVKGLSEAKLLNCFSYTCAFSIAAACANPKLQTINLDLSAKFLNWGKENYILNKLLKEGRNHHEFWRCDVMKRLPRLSREGRKFNIIILDPPSFSRGEKGRVFRVLDDFKDLVDLAIQCAAINACILLSSNHSQLSLRNLRNIGSVAAGKNARRCRFHQEAIPKEFENGPAATSLWMEMD